MPHFSLLTQHSGILAQYFFYDVARFVCEFFSMWEGLLHFLRGCNMKTFLSLSRPLNVFPRWNLILLEIKWSVLYNYNWLGLSKLMIAAMQCIFQLFKRRSGVSGAVLRCPDPSRGVGPWGHPPYRGCRGMCGTSVRTSPWTAQAHAFNSTGILLFKVCRFITITGNTFLVEWSMLLKLKRFVNFPLSMMTNK